MAITDFASLLFHQLRAAEQEASRRFEVLIGVVVDIKDPQQLQRVKVRLPALGSDATWWCPRIVIGAGHDRGWFTAPEVEDEVVVAFEHGDIERPVIIGALWNGTDRAADANASGDNPRRVFKSKTGHTVTFDDKDGAVRIADGGGIGTITIAKDGGVTIEAKQGDVAIQAKEDLDILAGQIEIKAKGNADLVGKSGGVDGTGTAGVKIDGNMVALKGATIDINPGGVPAAAKASGEVAEVPGADPGEGGTPSTSEGAQGAAHGGPSGGGAGGSSGAAASAAPGPAAAAAATEDDVVEPVPALISASWSLPRVLAGADVSLGAFCLDLTGQPASFAIRTADGDEPVATVSGTCGDALASATWTTPTDAKVARYVFTVTVGDRRADSDVLTLVKPFKATLVLDEMPAVGVAVELETVETGERIPATADLDGKIDIPEASVGTWKLHLIDAENT